ncbi:hypothetical protein FNV43_RR03866 [Rhamnella rubrinervis]|uniref:F-box domain-containing protein n=1 Tax=Rhamnella rubrinervis TaxID=2594499 RepID=A0A8K0MP24_9ROSA|nr:hypothetical protein FNV43_RR03866 [Rhamnella rubrinervis]
MQQEDERGKELPREILVQIFCKLPAKVVGQLSSVCKSWYEIVTDPTFIAMHVDWCAKNQTGFEYLISYTGSEISRLRRKSFDFKETLRLPQDQNSLKFKLKLVGSCHGLLCLTTQAGRPYIGAHTYLWNPLIGVLKKLRGLSGKLKKLSCMHVRRRGNAFGFGFDSGTGDYKVFQIVRLNLRGKDGGGGHRWVTTKWVYSLATNSWKQVKEADDDDDAFPTEPDTYYYTTYVNGACYWMQTRDPFSSTVIKWFDFSDETIRKTKLPVDDYYDDDDDKDTNMTMGSLNNSLALFVTHLEEQPPPTVNVVNVWLLKKDIESSSTSSSSSSFLWVKQLSAVLSQYHLWYIKTGLDDEILPLRYRSISGTEWRCGLNIYDIKKQTITEVDDDIYHERVPEIFTYSESLLLPS